MISQMVRRINPWRRFPAAFSPLLAGGGPQVRQGA
jgi:hypothetical protein